MNQLIHSYTIIFSFDNKDILNGIFINSDITKEKSLYYLPIYTILTIFLTVSEGDITDAISYRELIGNDKKDKPVFGEMKLKKTLYSYPKGFSIKKAIVDTMQGKIYTRNDYE